eukprot:g81150.t1
MPYGLSAAPNNTHHEVRVSPSGARSDGVPLKLLPPRGYRRREPSDEPKLLQSHIGPSSARSIVVKCAYHGWDKYSPTTILHVGVTDSKGAVYHFDKLGRRKESRWPQCLSIPLDSPIPADAWDEKLDEFLAVQQATSRREPFHELNNNCHNFLLRFLNFTRYKDTDKHTKESIASQKIATPLAEVELFLAANKKLGKQQFVPWGSADMAGAGKSKVHICDGCERQVVPPEHFRCLDCTDLDLCKRCYELRREPGDHISSHRMQQQT